MLRGIDGHLSKHLEVEVRGVENPLHNIILGAGRALEEQRYSKLLGL